MLRYLPRKPDEAAASPRLWPADTASFIVLVTAFLACRTHLSSGCPRRRLAAKVPPKVPTRKPADPPRCSRHPGPGPRQPGKSHGAHLNPGEGDHDGPDGWLGTRHCGAG